MQTNTSAYSRKNATEQTDFAHFQTLLRCTTVHRAGLNNWQTGQLSRVPHFVGPAFLLIFSAIKY